ncbi:2Fe-2S iron-sulfur cluster-binding protein [Romboutsia sp.]|uniref:2Fe-2S iron-sulfur cluster-binding protein n=1 Tax=Romboutsia sp. TaxID=1965302 RepID=UPI002F3F46C2
MKKANMQLCADAGSKYCPCHLAYSGDCIKCPIICGKKNCDCLWQGVCIYNELQHSKNVPICERKKSLCKIKEVDNLGNDTFLVKIQVPNDMIRDLCSPGAYVLIKSQDKNSDVFNAPISVMDVDMENSILEVIIKPRGIKTKNIINFDEVWVKGPYFNGIFGIKQIKGAYKTNTVVVLNGLSQVNSINIVKRLLENKNNVEVFINNQATILEVVIDKLKNLGVNIYNTDLNEDRDFLIDYIRRNNVELVYSGGANAFNKYVMDIVNSVDENINFAISNNNLICCGEGVCGACTIDINGEKVKSCKAQIDSRDFLNSKNL